MPNESEYHGVLVDDQGDSVDDGLLRPKLVPFDGKELEDHLAKVLLKNLPEQVQRRILNKVAEEKGLSQQSRKTRTIFGAIGEKTACAAMTVVRDQLADKDIRFLPQVLLARDSAAAAYRLLIDVIGNLGPPPDPPFEPEDKRGPEFYERQATTAKDAFGRFVGTFNPSCYTVYFRNRRLNRTYLLDSNVFFREAMEGFVWTDDFPTRVIYDETHAMVYSSIPEVETRPPLMGTFAKREGLVGGRVMALRLAWDQSQVAIFMSWRKDEMKSAHQSLVNILGENQGDMSDDSGAGLRKVVDLAGRYFVGWLTAAHLDLSQYYDRSPVTDPTNLMVAVASAACTEVREASSNALEQLIKDHVIDYRDIPNRYCSVHWTEENQIVFREGHYDGKQGESRPKFSLSMNNHCLVNKSICAQAAAWKVSLLIRDLGKALPDGRTWDDIHQARAGNDWKCKSEIAVPIMDPRTRSVLAVVNVESAKQDLDVRHLRHIELVSHLFQKLRAVYELNDDSLARKKKSLINSLVGRDGSEPVRNAQKLCRRFCGWIRDELQTALAFILIYDARVRVYRPMGITLHCDTVKKLLTIEDEFLRIQVGHRKTRSNSRDDKADSHGGGASFAESEHRALEHAIASRLLPRRRGKTWTAFRDTERAGIYIYDKWNMSDLREPDRTYTPLMAAMPFRHDINAHAEGVLWLGWSEDSKQGWNGSDDSRAEAKDRITACMHEVLEAIAAMYTVFRFYNPDAAANPLPFVQPSEAKDRRV